MKKLLLLISIIGTLCSCNKNLHDEPLPNLSTKNNFKPLYARDNLYDLLGFGYDVTREYANSNSSGGQVINVQSLDAQNPGRVIPSSSGQQYGRESYGSTAYTYAQSLSNKLTATVGFTLFGATITSNYSDADNFSSKYLYGDYTLMIQQKSWQLNAATALLQNYLTPAFLADIQNQTPAYIVSHYGTHVCSHIILGGRLQVMYRAQTLSTDRTIASATGLKANVKTYFNVDYTSSTNTSSNNSNSNETIVYSTLGGDPSKTLIGTFSTPGTSPPVSITDWQNSVTPSNSELIDFDSNDGLIPIYDLVADVNKAAALKSYVNQYIINNQVTVTNSDLYPFPSQYANRFWNFTSPNPDLTSYTTLGMNDNQPLLSVNQSVYSPSRYYRFTLQNDGNLVLYRNNGNGTETGIWSTNTNGRPGGDLYFQTDGNLVIYTYGHSPSNPVTGIWASNLNDNNGTVLRWNSISSKYKPYLALQNDGNLVLYWPAYKNDGSQQYVLIDFASTDTDQGHISTHSGNLNTFYQQNPYNLGSFFVSHL